VKKVVERYNTLEVPKKAELKKNDGEPEKGTGKTELINPWDNLGGGRKRKKGKKRIKSDSQISGMKNPRGVAGNGK